jgi:A/G-specific adenine glycosylase
MLRETMAEQGHSRESEAERKLAAKLLAWYDRHRRDLPWRARCGIDADPYRVWLSEIMLQQTTVAAVEGYYLKFIRRWPSIGALAAAPLDDVLKAWAGLGYYARARNLHACAKAIVEEYGGRFPGSEEELRALPGIGRYTAAAIAAIAFKRRAVAIDSNAERVLARLFAIEAPLPEAKPLIRECALAIAPSERSGDYAQALMDLGATVCTPRRASCLICPWAEECEGSRRGIAERLPIKRTKPPLPTRRGVAFWIEREDQLLLRRRPERGLLGGMMEIPSTPWGEHLPRDPASHAPLGARWVKGLAQVAHTFTHFRLELEVWRAAGISEARLNGDYRWIPLCELDQEALPSVMRKIVAALRDAPAADRRPPY